MIYDKDLDLRLKQFYNMKYPSREFMRSFQNDCSLKRRAEITASELDDAKIILDVGGGAGKVADYIKKYHDMRIIVIDISETLLKNQDNECVICDSQKLPFKSSSFDVVYSLQVLEHVPKPREMIAEMVRISKNSFILSTDICTSETRSFEPQLNNDGHIYVFNVKSLKTCLQKHGLILHKTYYPTISRRLWGFISNQRIIDYIESSWLLGYIIRFIPKFRHGNIEGLFVCKKARQ